MTRSGDIQKHERFSKGRYDPTMNKKILYIFTRTPLHVGAGSSVGAIDQPIQRERHTGFPIMPASSLKGPIADVWNEDLVEEEGENGKRRRVRVGRNGERSPAAWLFGSDDATEAFAGAVQFSEGRLLAFPIRSAKGSFAWITSPLILRRAARDIGEGIATAGLIPEFPKGSNEADGCACFAEGGELAIGDKIVLEDYAFRRLPGECGKLGENLRAIWPEEPVWNEISKRLVILSDGMMSFFARNACEIAQHVRINDETGTADEGGLFNQENVPSETLFYSAVHFFKERDPGKKGNGRAAEEAEEAFRAKLNEKAVYQFGGDASTGLGYCSVKLD